MKNVLIVLLGLVLLFAVIFLLLWINSKKLKKKYGDSENGSDSSNTVTVSNDDDFETILEKFNVPKEHYPVVIAQSKVYSLNNCPAVLWIEEDKVKALLFRSHPTLVEEDLEDFHYIASSPYVNFRQFDGSYFPDWASQSKEMRERFLPYVEMGVECGGLDFKRQTYWAGTMCVYSKSLAEIFRMIKKPLSSYEMRIDNMARMRKDGSFPPEMLAEWDKERKEAALEAEAAEQTAASKDMDAVWEAIRRLENKSNEEISAEKINRLNAYLISEKRFDDLERSTKDPEFQKELLKELSEN